MKTKILLLLFILSGLTPKSLKSQIINIPNDYPSIQEGINAAFFRDTVLIAPGIYYEGINFNGKNITVGSLFITTGDTTYISNTIIDGMDSTTVVTFANGENLSAKLIGITIQNGSAFLSQGGGIFCLDSRPKLSNLKIVNNYSHVGGGVYCNNSQTHLSDVIIQNNTAYSKGGGIFCTEGSNIELNNVIIINNDTYWRGCCS